MTLKDKSNPSLENLLNAEFFISMADFSDRCIKEDVSTVDLAHILLCVNVMKINSFLEQIGWVVNEKGYWIVTKKALENGYLYNKRGKQMPYITKKGVNALFIYYIKGALPLKQHKKDE